MCGIAGAVGSKSQSTVQSVLESIKYRGNRPAEILNISESITFGHVRLAIIDQSDQSKQPITSPSGRYTITYNGEIYNFKSFGNYLSDTLMIADQLDKVGMACFNWFDGMFACAIYDSQLNTITLICDATAQKPIYYETYENGYESDEIEFVFSSSPGSIVNANLKQYRLSTEAIYSLLALGGVQSDLTLFTGIKKLPAGHEVTYHIDTKRIEIHHRIKLTPHRHGNIEDVIIESLQSVKVSDVPIHLLLSGGIDSTLTASQMHGIDAIHLQSDELQYAQQAADRYGINLHVCPIAHDKSAILREYSTKTGECSMSAVQPYLVCRELSKFGHVGITANGADELFYGYDRTHQQSQLDHIFRNGAGLQYYFEAAGTFGIGGNTDDALERLVELYTYIQYDLNKTLDHASMIHTVEMRSPYLNKKLIETALSYKHRHLVNQTHGNKAVLKQMLSKDGFDYSFLNRPKIGFSIPNRYQQDGSKYLKWCIDSGFISKNQNWTPRDLIYLKATAHAFYEFYNVWNHRIR